MADWQAIETEYITTNISYCKLAQKHGVPERTLCHRGKNGNWPELRRRYRSKTVAKAVDKITAKKANKIARIDDLADQLLVKLEQAITELDRYMVVHKDKLETEGGEKTTQYTEAVEGGVVDRRGLKQIASALKDIKEVKMIRSELDRQEQEARIAALQKQSERNEDRTDQLEVVFLAGEEGWNG